MNGSYLRNTTAVLAIGACFLLDGCMTTGDASRLAQQTVAPGWEMADASDLTFCVTAFHRKMDRWPTDFAELSKFIDHSDGYLALDRKYAQVQFEKLGEWMG